MEFKQAERVLQLFDWMHCSMKPEMLAEAFPHLDQRYLDKLWLTFRKDDHNPYWLWGRLSKSNKKRLYEYYAARTARIN